MERDTLRSASYNRFNALSSGRCSRTDKVDIDRTDRISSLPCEIRGKILQFLPLNQAVRSSLFSRQWIDTWTWRSELQLNSKACPRLDGGSIVRVLQAQKGPLQKFTVSLNWTLSPQALKCIITELVKKNVPEVSLKTSDNYDIDNPIYLLPSEIYTSNILHLTLMGYIAVPPRDLKIFTRLVTLRLEYGALEAEIIRTLLSRVPTLQLVFLNCNEVEHPGHFVVESPNLRHFGIVRTTESAESICFENTPKLEEITMQPIAGFSNLPRQKATLLMIRVLTISVELHLVASVRKALYVITELLPNLVTLRVNCINGRNFASVCTLLREERKNEHTSLTRLERVEMLNMMGRECGLEFIRYVLSSAARLARVSVLFHKDVSLFKMNASMASLKKFNKTLGSPAFTSDFVSSWEISKIIQSSVTVKLPEDPEADAE